LLGFDEPSSADLHAHVLIDRPEDVCEYMIEYLLTNEEGQPASQQQQSAECHRLGASHCKMPLLGFLASATMSATLATSIGRLMEGDAPVSPAARPTWGTCGGTDCC
jgi:hypothetical protein